MNNLTTEQKIEKIAYQTDGNQDTLIMTYRYIANEAGRDEAHLYIRGWLLLPSTIKAWFKIAKCSCVAVRLSMSVSHRQKCLINEGWQYHSRQLVLLESIDELLSYYLEHEGGEK